MMLHLMWQEMDWYVFMVVVSRSDHSDMCVFQATEEGGETVACYSVCVSLVEGEEAANSRWSVLRKLTEFQMLHRKLTEVHTTPKTCTCNGNVFFLNICRRSTLYALYFMLTLHYHK